MDSLSSRPDVVFCADLHFDDEITAFTCEKKVVVVVVVVVASVVLPSFLLSVRVFASFVLLCC